MHTHTCNSESQAKKGSTTKKVCANRCLRIQKEFTLTLTLPLQGARASRGRNHKEKQVSMQQHLSWKVSVFVDSFGSGVASKSTVYLRSCNDVVKKGKAVFVKAGLVLDEHTK